MVINVVQRLSESFKKIRILDSEAKMYVISKKNIGEPSVET